MGYVIELQNGVKFVRTAQGFTVISKWGEKTEFDLNGVCMSTKVDKKPEWTKFFTSITHKERKLVLRWYYDQKVKGKEKNDFLHRVYRALKSIDYDYLIANIEPSIDEEKGKLYYKQYNPVCVGMTCRQWDELAKSFSTDYGTSELACLEEFDLWLAYRIATENLTLEEACDSSYMLGNYWNAPLASRELEPSGLRCVAGEKDGIGNTYKIVRNKNGFALCGGSFEFEAAYCPITDVRYYESPESFCTYGCGVVVVKNFN